MMYDELLESVRLAKSHGNTVLATDELSDIIRIIETYERSYGRANDLEKLNADLRREREHILSRYESMREYCDKLELALAEEKAIAARYRAMEQAEECCNECAQKAYEKSDFTAWLEKTHPEYIKSVTIEYK